MLCVNIEETVNSMKRTYSELILLPTFEERYLYLKLDGKVAEETFGFRRWLNQKFYHSDAWRNFRDRIIVRDQFCDLAMPGFDIPEHTPIYIHHLNPITYEDIVNRNPCIFDPENAVCTIFNTHTAIHYGDESQLPFMMVERTKNDTCPWKR